MQYQAETKYTWSPEAKIEVSGRDFEVLYKSLTSFMAAPAISPMSVMRVMEACALTQRMLISMVESGVATPETTKEASQVTEL